MELLQDKNRDYQRYRHNARERSFLGLQGLQPVLSSNVSSVGVRGDSLIIRFHNGSMYEYPNQSTKYDDILRSNSKGKWVWRFLRRARVPYQKIGILPLPDDIGITDEEIFQEIDNRYMADLTRHVDVPVFQSFEFIKGMSMQKILVGNIATYVPITAPLPIVKQPIAVAPSETIEINIINQLPSDTKEALKIIKADENRDIKKVLSSRGFDRPPQLVDKETFLNQYKKTKVVIARGYKAPETEIVKGYRKQMETGDFFIDNTGGAVYGRGMYFAKAEYGNENKVQKLEKIVKGYAGSMFGGLNQNSIIDVATVTDDFKAINSKDVSDTFLKEYSKKVFNDNEYEIVKPYFDIQDEIKDLVALKIEAKSITDIDKAKQKINKINTNIDNLKAKQRQLGLPQDLKEKLNDIQDISGSGDIGVRAALMGYDAVYVEEQDFYVVVNRSKLVLLDNGGDAVDSLNTIKV